MFKLILGDYEKNKSLFKEEYLVWDSSKKDFIKEDSKKVVVEIKDIKELSAKEKDDLKMILENWKKEIPTIDIKKCTYSIPSLSSSEFYTKIASNIETCIFKFEKSEFFRDTYNNYFCCYIKHNDLCVAISLFSMPKEERRKRAKLEYSLVCPQSQSVREKRKKGTFGACGHNLRVSMINYIFSNKNIKYIASYPINSLAKEALKKLKFNEI